MRTLSHDRFIKARDYIFAHAGDIDRAWFRYIFEDSGEDSFLAALEKYQHENGGFGGLCYEFAYQGPCLKSTETAVKYILNLRIRPSADHPVVRRTMEYLLSLYRPKLGNWGAVTVPAVNDDAHCFWVGYDGEGTVAIEDGDERIRLYDANERVCFAAFVACYPELVPEALYSEIIRYPTEHILRHWDRNSPHYDKTIFERREPYYIEYFQGFVPFLKDRELADRLTSILRQDPTVFMELDYSKSDDGYVHLPCDVVSSPDSILYPTVKALVDESLDYRLAKQSADGRWPLGWSFGGDDRMQRLQVMYEAYLTLNMLVRLKRFGRIED